MPENLPTRRRYTEKEVSRLLKRAAELQHNVPAPANPSGVTLDELAQAAREAGLDPALVRQAAAELDAGGIATTGPKLGSALAGAPLRLVLEQTVPGEIKPAAFSALVPRIQAASEVPGQASQVGTTLTWNSANPSNTRMLQVLISSHEGQTLIRIEERYAGLAAALFGGVVGGLGGVGLGVGGAIGGALGSVALAVALPTSLVLGTYVAARQIFRAVARRRRRILEQLMDSIVREVRPLSM